MFFLIFKVTADDELQISKDLGKKIPNWLRICKFCFLTAIALFHNFGCCFRLMVSFGLLSANLWYTFKWPFLLAKIQSEKTKKKVWIWKKVDIVLMTMTSLGHMRLISLVDVLSSWFSFLFLQWFTLFRKFGCKKKRVKKTTGNINVFVMFVAASCKTSQISAKLSKGKKK